MPNADGSWTQTALYSFNNKDGAYPGGGGLIFDAAGNLDGTTENGGAHGWGTVFQLTPNADGSWKEKVLHSFTGGKDGRSPTAGLIFDHAGNLYSTTEHGGRTLRYCNYGCGVVFELTPNADGSWKEKVLHSFTGGKGGFIPNDLIFDPAGNLYGTTNEGGAYEYGVVFTLTPTSTGGWTYRELHAFKDAPGARPVGYLIVDGAGNLYGTTSGYDIETWGSVFEITP
jgi:uncharacterized repeat protein (TIGR03803 family)